MKLVELQKVVRPQWAAGRRLSPRGFMRPHLEPTLNYGGFNAKRFQGIVEERE